MDWRESRNSSDKSHRQETRIRKGVQQNSKGEPSDAKLHKEVLKYEDIEVKERR